MPDSLTTPVSRVVEGAGLSSKNFCDAATTDLQGNVAVLFSGPGPAPWTIWSTEGTKSGTFYGRSVVPQAVGFEGVFFDRSVTDPNQQSLYAWTPTGSVSSKTVVGTTAGLDWVSSFPATTGGSVVLSLSCRDNLNMQLVVSRFDGAGVLVSSANLNGAGCVDSDMSALSDDFDRTLVVVTTGGSSALGFPAGRIIARWLDRNGTALSSWFDAGSQMMDLRPLVGGGAVGSHSGHWVGSFPSGIARIDPVPAFLTDGDELYVVRKGKAYAIVHPSPQGALDLYSSAGQHCGAMQLPNALNLRIGADSTVISMGGADGCSVTWWPSLLR